MKKSKTPKEQFLSYFFSFYAPYQIYGSTFNHKLNEKEVVKGLKLLEYWSNKKGRTLEYDTTDREILRDIILAFSYKTNPTKLEHWSVIYNLKHQTITEEVVVKQWTAYYRQMGLKVSNEIREEWATRSHQVALELNS